MSLPKLFTFSSGIVDGISGVHTGPGATAFTRMLRFMELFDSAFVKFTIAAFVDFVCDGVDDRAKKEETADDENDKTYDAHWEPPLLTSKHSRPAR